MPTLTLTTATTPTGQTQTTVNLDDLSKVIEYSVWFEFYFDGRKFSALKSELTTDQVAALQEVAVKFTPKKKSKRNTTRRSSGRTPRSWNAAQVLSRVRALGELVERVNGEEREAA